MEGPIDEEDRLVEAPADVLRQTVIQRQALEGNSMRLVKRLAGVDVSAATLTVGAVEDVCDAQTLQKGDIPGGGSEFEEGKCTLFAVEDHPRWHLPISEDNTGEDLIAVGDALQAHWSSPWRRRRRKNVLHCVQLTAELTRQTEGSISFGGGSGGGDGRHGFFKGRELLLFRKRDCFIVYLTLLREKRQTKFVRVRLGFSLLLGHSYSDCSSSSS